MGGGLEIYATRRRFFGKKGDRVVDIRYKKVIEAKRRTSYWKTWGGMTRITLGTIFVATGVLTGVESPMAASISLALFMTGSTFILLGILKRDDWVELTIAHTEPPPSFWYIIVFLPFWLLLRSRKRYRVPGSRQAIDAFYQYLLTRLLSP